MAQKQVMKYEILEDGQIKFQTEAVPGEHHAAADELLNEVAELMGGAREVVGRKNKVGVATHHQHSHTHVQAGHGHTHD